MATKVLNNVVINWCKFNMIDQYGHFGCSIELNQEAVDKLTSCGLGGKIKQDKDDPTKLLFRARAKEEDGPIEVVDSQLNRITSSIANGAVANVMLDVYQYKRYGGGVAARLKKVQLLSWEPYDDGDSFSIVEVDGEDII